MVKHVILWKLKEELGDKSRQEVLSGIKDNLEALAGKVPGLINITVITSPLASSNTDVMLDSELENERRSQIGSADRSEKIRTYNYPQGRITDHRIGMSIYQMENFLNGDLDEMIDNLTAADTAEKLKGNE